MIFSLTWLPAVLEGAGLKIALVPGWESRGRADMGTVVGVICHHTAGPRAGNMPSLNLLVQGRADLAGPLSQLGLGRDGTYYVIAAGRCNHAGAGTWQGVTTGNSSFIGIEAENTGRPDDSPWPEVQMDAYRRGVAAILTHVGRGAEFCAGHKEYAQPPGRKTDPDFNMEAFRIAVAGLMSGASVPRPLIPRTEPAPAPGVAARRTLRRGDHGELVVQLQQKLRLAPPEGFFGAGTEAAVREFQRQHQLVPDGIVGPKSWLALDGSGAST
ncbi:N-acetylmuramoyl-L-alanine amidase [Variovorax sp. J2P1-59]|uniref:peptidoglycan recognition protein family protein n=1 Tax=Variovorax flavidus TaxID=3053501 RepID=UPI0025756D57|nr:N-acetylmuramoyl-L-alanine amidase [Variovorax sp. J2P1-59]MDM0072844.1 N-acetylmuramoyl-L-alanine amidase [Variovorax sp. J2P1-59]